MTPTVKILDDSPDGIPEEVTITIPISDDLARLLIQPCLATIAETAQPTMEVCDDRLMFGVSLGTGLSSILYDLENELPDFLGPEDVPVAIASMERTIATLKKRL